MTDYMREEAEEYALGDDAVCPACGNGEYIAVWIQGELGYDAKMPSDALFREWARFKTYSCECGYESDDGRDFKPKEDEKNE